MESKITKIKFYKRTGNILAKRWEIKIKKWLEEKHPEIKITGISPDAIIALGGDGTILEAARKCVAADVLLVGLNLGTVGFLASVYDSEKFFSSLEKIFLGKYFISERMMLDIRTFRNKKTVFETNALNELAIINPLGMVETEVFAHDFQLQKIKGTGVIIATPTGSTALNLSAHGPVVMPELKAFIITELLDHNIPTPSMILNPDQVITVKIANFRKKHLLKISDSNIPAEVILSADGEIVFSLEIGDKVEIRQSSHFAKFCELGKYGFLNRLQEKFDFK